MATFYIQTEKDFYFAGDTVNGAVFVNAQAMIVGAQGLSLKFSGYQCVKWVEAKQLFRPRPPVHRPGHPPPPPPFDPIAAIPPHLLVRSDNLNISDCESQGNVDYDQRPRYIRTSQDRYFQMKYFETRNMFTKQKMMIFNCSGFAPGQYSFPFSFKTFEGWPASFNYHTPQKKGIIIYHMTAAIEPLGPQFQIQGSRQIIMRQTRMVQTQNRESNAEITSCCCIPRGYTLSKMSFEKDGYTPGQLVQMIIQIDNTNCKANVSNISITVNRTVSLRSQGHGTTDHATLFRKTTNGVAAGQAFIGNNCIRQQFQMPMNPQMKPTCSGKLLSAQYSLNINLNHDITCECCSKRVGSGVPVIIFPIIPVYNMPPVFQNNWAPQRMPETILVLPNNFANFNLNAMNNQQMGMQNNMY